MVTEKERKTNGTIIGFLVGTLLVVMGTSGVFDLISPTVVILFGVIGGFIGRAVGSF